MNVIGLTSLVQNAPNAKQLGLVPFYYRYRSADPHFPNRTQTSVGGFTPAEQYQKLKVIHRTVRQPASLYVANLAPLHAYTPAQGIRWNQMSDRPVPSVQKATVPTGINNARSRKHTSVTSSRPGCQTPGGVGCDIKHNSYDRYLNRLKGKGALRRGVVPSSFGTPIAFQRANPIYGGKTMKPNMIDRCGCPPADQNEWMVQGRQLYRNPLYFEYPTALYGFQVGQYVYATQDGTDYLSRALITTLNSEIYTIRFDNGATQEATANELRIYFSCTCDNYMNDDNGIPMPEVPTSGNL